MPLIALIALFCVLVSPIRAQEVRTNDNGASGSARDTLEDASDMKWDVNAAHGPTETVRFTSDEGTWMNLSLSPDGQEIVFDLLGDLYVMPITGGTAERLSGGGGHTGRQH